MSNHTQLQFKISSSARHVQAHATSSLELFLRAKRMDSEAHLSTLSDSVFNVRQHALQPHANCSERL